MEKTSRGAGSSAKAVIAGRIMLSPEAPIGLVREPRARFTKLLGLHSTMDGDDGVMIDE